MELTHAYDRKVHFDIDDDGHAERVGWVKADDGLVAMDRNGNGNIDDITELYGDDEMPAYDKLRQHDANKDGKIDARDPDYAGFAGVARYRPERSQAKPGSSGPTPRQMDIKNIHPFNTGNCRGRPISWPWSGWQC